MKNTVKGEPYAVCTVPGWAVLGPVDVVGLCHSQKVSVNVVDRSFKTGMSVEDKESLKMTEGSVPVAEGHYLVGMLWKSEDPWLPNNRHMALARL